MGRLVEGQNRLKDAGLRIMSTFVELSDRCAYDHGQVVGNINDALAWRFEYYGRFLTTDLGELAGYKIIKYFPERVCADCRDGVKESIEQERRRIWNEIPEYFGLGDWGSVRAKLRARIEDHA